MDSGKDQGSPIGPGRRKGETTGSGQPEELTHVTTTQGESYANSCLKEREENEPPGKKTCNCGAGEKRPGERRKGGAATARKPHPGKSIKPAGRCSPGGREGFLWKSSCTKKYMTIKGGCQVQKKSEKPGRLKNSSWSGTSNKKSTVVCKGRERSTGRRYT